MKNLEKHTDVCKFYALKLNTGTTSIMGVQDGHKVEDCIAKFERPGVREVVEFVEITEDEIPKDRTFRNAWILEKKVIKECIEKSKDIHMSRIRQKRNEKLKALDVDIMRAMESGDKVKTKELADLKQKLRDLPETFSLDHCKNCKDLKKAWPEELEKHDIYKD